MRQPKKRYTVTIWHGASGSIGVVIDRKTRRIKGRCSTFRDGVGWRELLEIQCKALNKAEV